MLVRLLTFTALLPAAELQPIFPEGVKPAGPFSPAIRAGSFVYVSGQGAQKPDGSFPPGTAAQTQQCLENVKAVLEAAGLTIQHIVYAQVYLTDLSAYEDMTRVWDSYFTGNRPPARAVIGVVRMPLDTPVEINAVAVTDLRLARLVRPRGYAMRSAVAPAVRAGDRVYVSGVLGRRADTNRMPSDADGQLKLALDHLRTVVKPAGIELSDLNIATVYVTDAIDNATADKRLGPQLPGGYTLVRVAALPFGANVEITGTSAADLRAQTGRGPTDDVLRGFGDLSKAIVSSVYIDDLEDFAAMNKAYAEFFPQLRPTRTTVQPLRRGAADGNQISIVSLK